MYFLSSGCHDPYSRSPGGRGGQGVKGGRGREEGSGEWVAYAAIGFTYTPMAARSSDAGHSHLEKVEVYSEGGEEDTLEAIRTGSLSELVEGQVEGQVEGGSTFGSLTEATHVEDEDVDAEEVVWRSAGTAASLSPEAGQSLVLSTYEQELEANPHFGLGFDSGGVEESNASPSAPAEAEIAYDRSAWGLGFGGEDIQSGPEGCDVATGDAQEEAVDEAWEVERRGKEKHRKPWRGVVVGRRRSVRGGGVVSSAGFLKIGGVKVFTHGGTEGGSVWVRGREKALRRGFDILNLDEDEGDEEGEGREEDMYVDLSDSETDEDAQDDYEKNLAEGGWEAGAEEMAFLAGRSVGEYAAIEDMRGRGESSDTDLSEVRPGDLPGA